MQKKTKTKKNNLRVIPDVWLEKLAELTQVMLAKSLQACTCPVPENITNIQWHMKLTSFCWTTSHREKTKRHTEAIQRIPKIATGWAACLLQPSSGWCNSRSLGNLMQNYISSRDTQGKHIHKHTTHVSPIYLIKTRRYLHAKSPGHMVIRDPAKSGKNRWTEYIHRLLKAEIKIKHGKQNEYGWNVAARDVQFRHLHVFLKQMLLSTVSTTYGPQTRHTVHTTWALKS